MDDIFYNVCTNYKFYMNLPVNLILWRSFSRAIIMLYKQKKIRNYSDSSDKSMLNLRNNVNIDYQKEKIHNIQDIVCALNVYNIKID